MIIFGEYTSVIIDKNENFYTDYKNKDSITLYYAEFPQRS